MIAADWDRAAGSSPHTRGAPGFGAVVDPEGGIIPAYAGSTLVRVANANFDRGSSPHTRGAPALGGSIIWVLRIIPAYAGSTDHRPRQAPTARDHPRIRGEHGLSPSIPPTTPGSSPHTRGARNFGSAACRNTGIIPAYAGSTTTPARAMIPPRDHPRIRGEHIAWHFQESSQLGSSPHTRGALVGELVGCGAAGIIPAYAGSTRPPRLRTTETQDHPRIRGEHPHSGAASQIDEGSSPHTRGARGGGGAVGDGVRIIPAYAGSTPPCYWRARSVRDHPRIRGEHGCQAILVDSDFGSSPHTRGARSSVYTGYRTPRIIPAYAGSTTRAFDWSSPLRDHPRIRGEHSGAARTRDELAGSSPHTRGAHMYPVSVERAVRIIPAYAGSTPKEADIFEGF